jgi:DNA topoisomerase-1
MRNRASPGNANGPAGGTGDRTARPTTEPDERLDRRDEDLDRQSLPCEKVLAAVRRLMDATLLRIGNEEYARQNRSHGLTTLRHERVRTDGPATIRFEFRAKSGKQQRVRLSDPRLAAVVHACHELRRFQRSSARAGLKHAEAAGLALL